MKSRYIPLNPYLRFYIFSLYPTLSAIYSQPQKTHSTHFNQSSTLSRSRFLATALEKPPPPLGSVPRPHRRTARHGRSADLPPTNHDMDPGLPGKHRKNRWLKWIWNLTFLISRSSIFCLKRWEMEGHSCFGGWMGWMAQLHCLFGTCSLLIHQITLELRFNAPVTSCSNDLVYRIGSCDSKS